MMASRCRWALALPLALTLAACGGGDDTTGSTAAEDDPSEPAGELTVVTTTSVLGDVVRNVAGDAAAVAVLMPPGADPHDYAPSAQDIALIAEADLVVANGLGLEESLHDALEAAEADGVHLLEIAPRLDPIPFGAHGHDEEADEEEEAGCDPDPAEEHDAEEGHEDEGEEGHAHEAGSCDPHVWTDPLRMAEAARLIAAELAQVDASVDWAANAETYAGELEAADEQIAAILEVVPADARILVTNHDALGYFAERYGFEVIATVIPSGSTLADPSSAELAELVDVVRDEGVRVIFAESIDPAAVAESVAAEVGGGVEVVELYTDALGEPGSGADTLIGMLVSDAELIAAALS